MKCEILKIIEEITVRERIIYCDCQEIKVIEHCKREIDKYRKELEEIGAYRIKEDEYGKGVS